MRLRRRRGGSLTDAQRRRQPTLVDKLANAMLARAPAVGEKYLLDWLRCRELRALRSNPNQRIVREGTRALEMAVRSRLKTLVLEHPIFTAEAELTADRVAQWKEKLDPDFQERQRSLDNPDEMFRVRERWANEYSIKILEFEAEMIGLSPGNIVALTGPARAVFDAIPTKVLLGRVAASDRERFYYAVQTYAAIVGRAIAGGRWDLAPLFLSLNDGLNALYELDRGFDPPLLRRRPRSPDMSRESDRTQTVKAWCAAAFEALKGPGVKEREAAETVARWVNRNRWLPLRRKWRSAESGESTTWKSIINWRSRLFMDLPVVFPGIEFREALYLRDKGRPGAAREKVLATLRERLGELPPN